MSLLVRCEVVSGNFFLKKGFGRGIIILVITFFYLNFEKAVNEHVELSVNTICNINTNW